MVTPSLIKMGIFIALVLTVIWPEARAQSGCTNVLLSMAPCLNYVTGASPSPSPSCCSQLASVVQSQPQCLCIALSGGSALPISINKTLALELPKACNVQTPPVSDCNAANGPATSPVSSADGTPEESSNGAPASPGSSSVSPPPSSSSVSGAGSKATPSNATSSDGSTVEMPLMFIALLLFMASYGSISSGF